MQAKLREHALSSSEALQALALAGLTSSSETDNHTATKKAIRDGLSSLLLLSVGTAAPVPPSA